MIESFKTDSVGTPYIIKSPAEDLAYTFDWSEYLQQTSATITDASFVVSGAVMGNAFHDDTTGTVFVSGGELGTTAEVTCTITTSDSNIASRSFDLIITRR